jgi:hypothetical protein
MGEESRELKHHIDETRNELDRNIRVLERKVRTTFDWRARFREHPARLLWMAFGMGVLLSGATSGRPARRPR